MATKIRPFNLHTDTETRIQTLAGNLIDSAYVNARVSTVDSAAVQVIVDSDYVKTTLKVGSTNTIFRYVSTANQTSFTGSDANSATLAYNPGAVQVFLNGSLLTPTVDFTTDSGDTITLVSGAALGSELVINTYKDGIITPTNALPIIGGELTGNLTMGDNKKIKLGNDSDAEIFHNASNTIINDKGTGNILLQVAGTTHFKTDANGVQIPDNKKLLLGASSDLQIYHDGSNSFVDDAGSGSLYLRGESQVIIGNMSGEQAAVFNDDGAVTLNHDNSQKLATTATGVSVTGSVVSNTGFSVGNTAVLGQEIDVSSGDFTLDVAGDIILDADGADIKLHHAGTHWGSIYTNATPNNLYIQNMISDGDIYFSGNDGGSSINALRLDMSDEGAAIFNKNITIGGQISLSGGTAQSGDFTTGGIHFHDASTSAGDVMPISFTPSASGNRARAAIGFISQQSSGVDGFAGAIGFYTRDAADGTAMGTSDERMRIEQNGRVGIGTANPSSKFVIYDATYPYIYLQNSTTGQGTNDGFSMVEYGTDIYINNRENGNMLFYNNGSERMRIDASGNVGIGTTTPGSFGSLTSDLVVGTTSGEHGMTIASGTGNSGRLQFADNTASPFRGAIEYAHPSDDLMFYTAGAQRMRIKSDGKVGINESSPDAMLHIVNGYPNTAIKTESNTTNGHWAIEFHNSNGRVGNIMTIGSATQFNTSSDYRLKENVKYDFDATSRLKQLKPARFNFIADADTTVDGFIAHEVSSIVPEAISGEKDAVDGDGKAVMQGIDQSKLVPLLVKTIQELEARITELENK